MLNFLIFGSICLISIQSAICVSEWPKGTYGIPEPKTGCPIGFLPGSRTRMVNGYSTSKNLSLSEEYNSVHKTITMKFCMKTQVGKGPEWPRGTYCIYKKGECPLDFFQGYIYWDDTAPLINPLVPNYQKTSGVIPDGTYNANTLIEYCCRADGSSPMVLSFSKPFFLMKYRGSNCQDVKGASVEVQESTSVDENINTNRFSGAHQTVVRVSEKGNKFRLFYCYYTAKELKVRTFLVVIYAIGSIVAACVLISCIMFMVRFFYQNRRMNSELSGESAQERMFRSVASEEEKLDELEEKDEPPAYDEVIKDQEKYKKAVSVRNPYREEI
ncbi:DgyrCDS1113 [Dimorphilus gyrociliatus]|uniref:DgyrCDS1113 n=1 Tax=Dimorphilus gyrociliatus TaxID=2664684 RepID=A0A7I8V8D5_9ANNE|nr:DgyrCDS1113 [Dimorphilus gyrociliatus]